MTKAKVTAPARPCASCPYRTDVPSGIWAKHEYDKLPAYDGDIPDQLMNGGLAIFMCHQRDGNLCAGWLACHGPDHLLALRFEQRNIDPAVFDYVTDVPVFKSGAEARAHGLRQMQRPGKKAKRLQQALVKKGKAKA